MEHTLRADMNSIDCKTNRIIVIARQKLLTDFKDTSCHQYSDKKGTATVSIQDLKIFKVLLLQGAWKVLSQFL